MNYLLDTNHVVFLRQQVQTVIDRADALPDQDRLITSVFVVAELMYGVENSPSEYREHNERLNHAQLAELDEVVPLSDAILGRWASIKAHVRRNGRMKQDVDLFIAATAIEAGATLLTDESALLDGDNPGLAAENWHPRASKPAR